MSSLTYDIVEFPFNRETSDSVREKFGKEIGKANLYPVYILLKTAEGWSNPQRMLYDTGAAISLLPSTYYEILGIENHAKAKLGGVVPASHLEVRIAPVKYKFTDLSGNSSEEYEAWFAIAERDDVPRIIGLKDVNMTHRLTVNAKEGTFSLDF